MNALNLVPLPVSVDLLGTPPFALDDKVVIVAGVPPGIPGTTNGMRVHMIGRSGHGSGV